MGRQAMRMDTGTDRMGLMGTTGHTQARLHTFLYPIRPDSTLLPPMPILQSTI